MHDITAYFKGLKLFLSYVIHEDDNESILKQYDIPPSLG